MARWDKDKKIAATILLILLGVSCLAGVAKIWVTVGFSPKKVKLRYSTGGDAKSADLESFLSDAPPPMSLEKLVHISHAHLMPYTFLFAILSFFIVSLDWTVRMKTVFLVVFALSIIGDFIFMFLTRFVNSGFHTLLMASGGVFGLCAGGAIVASLYELWLSGKDDL